MELTSILIGIVVGLAIGFAIAKFLEKSNVSNLIKNAKKEASSILRDAKAEAETEKRNKLLQAKERFLELKTEHENEILSKDKKMAENTVTQPQASKTRPENQTFEMMGHQC